MLTKAERIRLAVEVAVSGWGINSTRKTNSSQNAGKKKQKTSIFSISNGLRSGKCQRKKPDRKPMVRAITAYNSAFPRITWSVRGVKSPASLPQPD